MGTWPYNAQTVDVAPRTGGHFGGLPTTQPSGCKAGLSETGEITACSLVSHWELTVLSLSQNRSWPLTAGYPWSTCTRCSVLDLQPWSVLIHWPGLFASYNYCTHKNGTVKNKVLTCTHKNRTLKIDGATQEKDHPHRIP